MSRHLAMRPPQTFGKAARTEPKDAPPVCETTPWWHAAEFQQDRLKFSEFRAKRQPHMDGTTLPIHLGRGADRAT